MFTALKMEDQVICNKTGSAKQDNYFRFYENIQKEKKTAYLRCFFLLQNILVDTEICCFAEPVLLQITSTPSFFFQTKKTKNKKVLGMHCQCFYCFK